MADDFFPRLVGTVQNLFRIGLIKLVSTVSGLEIRRTSDDGLEIIIVDGVRIANGAVDGYVLTSDVNGLGSWEPAPSGGGGSTMSIVTFGGELSVSSSPFQFTNRTGATRTLSEVYLTVSNAPVGSSLIVDIHKNGTTLFTTQSNRPSIADGLLNGQTTTFDTATWLQGDILTVHIDQIGSTSPGENLVVHLVHS